MGGLSGQFSLKEQDANQPTVAEFLRTAEEETKTEGKTEKEIVGVWERERGSEIFWKLGHRDKQRWCFVFCWMQYREQDRDSVLIANVEERANTLPHSVCLICVEFDQLRKGLGLIWEETSRIHECVCVCMSVCTL